MATRLCRHPLEGKALERLVPNFCKWYPKSVTSWSTWGAVISFQENRLAQDEREYSILSLDDDSIVRDILNSTVGSQLNSDRNSANYKNAFCCTEGRLEWTRKTSSLIEALLQGSNCIHTH